MLRSLRGATGHNRTIWWVLIVVTVVTFLGGFVFLLGSGLSSGSRARMTGAVGTVNGEAITQTELVNAVQEQREAFKRQYGSDPTERDLQMVEVQAWRGIVTQKLLAAQARSLGIKAHDRDILLSLQSSPPPQLQNLPMFQTDGKFDPAKYQQALMDPGINWAPFEEVIVRQVPVRKLQERLLASIKLSEPELRQAFRDRFERADVVVAQVLSLPDSAPAPPTEADLAGAYERHKARFGSGARTQLEVLAVPKAVGEDAVRAARELAQSLAERTRRGEDFADLCRDYSDGPNADKGGVVERFFQPSDFGPEMAPRLAGLKAGEVSDPFLDGTRFILFKVLERNPATPPAAPALKVAQLVVKVRPDDDSRRRQIEDLRRLRNRAARIGLGKAAAERGLATIQTEWYDYSGSPQALFGVPEASDWGLSAKRGAVGPVFEGLDEFVIAQVAAQRAAGIEPREGIENQLRPLAELDRRVERSRPAADAMARELAAGRTLEQAAKSAGVTLTKIEGLTRQRSDPRLAGAPELVGALFAARRGAVVGPLRGLNGWYFGRLDRLISADSASFEPVRGQLTTEILQRRQQSFFLGYLSSMRGKAKVEDLRGELASP